MARVRVSNNGADGVVIADAVQLIPVGSQSKTIKAKETIATGDTNSLEGVVADVSTHVLFYIDGKLHQTTHKSVLIHTDITSKTARPVKMGRNMGFRGAKVNDKQHAVFRGDLDEVYIFDAALSGNQIQRLMESNRID